jgi:hypothetical protein
MSCLIAQVDIRYSPVPYSKFPNGVNFYFIFKAWRKLGHRKRACAIQIVPFLEELIFLFYSLFQPYNSVDVY